MPCPKVLEKSAAEKVYRFALKEGDVQFANKVIDCARGAAGLQVLWGMNYEEAKGLLIPRGIGIFNKTQLVLPGDGTYFF